MPDPQFYAFAEKYHSIGEQLRWPQIDDPDLKRAVVKGLVQDPKLAELQIALEKLRLLRAQPQPTPKLSRHRQCRACRKKLNLEPTQLREMLAQLLNISRRQLYRRYGAKGLARRIGQKFARDSGV